MSWISLSRRSFLIFCALCVVSIGCSIGYVVRQGIGQISIAFGSRDIGRMMEDPNVPERDKERLQFILDVKSYAERKLSLAPSDNYTTFYDTDGMPVSYVVSACRADRFEANLWSFLVIGNVPYKGFFDLEDAERERKRLETDGYDVALHPVAAYSTLGWFTDPVFSPMLNYPRARLADVIIHELVHGTVYAKGQGDFNEGLASFIAAKGAIRFLEERGETLQAGRAKDYYDDERRFMEFVRTTIERLTAIYAAGTPREETLRRKAEVLKGSEEELSTLLKEMKTRSFDHYAERTLNNAELLALRRYNRDELFTRVFERVGGCFRCFIAIMKTAAEQPDAIKWLENRVSGDHEIRGAGDQRI